MIINDCVFRVLVCAVSFSDDSSILALWFHTNQKLLCENNNNNEIGLYFEW